MVNFGTLRCKHNENLCAKLGREHGIIYYGTDDVAKDKGTVSESLSLYLSLSFVACQAPEKHLLYPSQTSLRGI